MFNVAPLYLSVKIMLYSKPNEVKTLVNIYKKVFYFSPKPSNKSLLRKTTSNGKKMKRKKPKTRKNAK